MGASYCDSGTPSQAEASSTLIALSKALKSSPQTPVFVVDKAGKMAKIFIVTSSFSSTPKCSGLAYVAVKIFPDDFHMLSTHLAFDRP